jgi:large conductance mechanosensitive channel
MPDSAREQRLLRPRLPRTGSYRRASWVRPTTFNGAGVGYNVALPLDRNSTDANQQGDTTVAGLVQEFKEFALRGNVVDLAVGLIIGAAFGAIVNSLVNDVVMPPLGLIVGQVDFSNLFINLSGQEYPSLAAAREAGAPVIAYGAFINVVINFIIVALAIFLLVKGMNRLRRQQAEEPAQPPEAPRQEVLLQEIRDILKARS